MNPDLSKSFYLKGLQVDPTKGEIAGASRSLHLPPKAMKVLLRLAAAPGELVSREDLIRDAWGQGRGSPEALSHAISEIRHALGDQPEQPQYIRTVPRRGYQLLVMPTTAPARDDSPTPGITPSVEELGLFDNLRQRGVLETALAYLVLGWLILQVVDVLFDQLHLPAWAGTFITVLLIAGFPIALALSWFVEIRHGRAVLDDLSARDARRRRFSRTYLSVIAAMALAAIAVYIYDQNIGLPEPDAPPAISLVEETVLPPVLDNSIAVLPFYNLDGSDETRIFSEGLVDDVITRLSRVPGLLVSSRGDAFTLAPNSPSEKVRERLRVALYVEGSVQIKDERMRIIIQLIDSDTGFHVLSRSFDRNREDFFDIRDEITELTVANVRVALPADTQAETSISMDDPSLDVYVIYRRGIEASRRPKTLENNNEALSLFDEALAIDADYAAAHAGKCVALVDAYPITDDPEFIDRAEVACSQALQLNPNLDIVHTALGELYEATGRYEAAEQAYLEALGINPNSVASLIGLGTIYMLQKRTGEAEARFTEAVGLHPGDWSAYNSLGYFLYRSGRYREAAVQYEVVVALDPGNMTGFANLGTAYMLAGEFSLAAPAFQKAIEIEPQWRTYSNLGLMQYFLGQWDAAIEAHSHAVKLAPNDHLAWTNLGDALWVAGKHEAAKKAFRTAESRAKSALEVNPNDPNYQMDLAWISTMLGQREEAQRLIDRARAQAPNDPYVHYIEGLMLHHDGRIDLALVSFKRAAELGYSLAMLAADPHLAELGNDPEFNKITQRAKPR